MKIPAVVAGLAISLFASNLIAQESHQPLTPPNSLKAEDMPNDDGTSLYLTWDKMPYEDKDVQYIIMQGDEKENEPFKEIATIPSNTGWITDLKVPFWSWSLSGLNKKEGLHFYQINNLEAGKKYTFKIATSRGAERVESQPVSATPYSNLFNWDRLNIFIFMILFSVVLLGFIRTARKRELFLRKIGGIDAIEEAVGRATEMGRPIFYLTGFGGVSNISTIAAISILGEIAKKVARYNAQIKVPNMDPIAMAVCQDITKQAYIAEGRPDAYRENINFFVTSDQFGFVAAVDGMMVREKPAACLYMGYYYAESLLLAETGTGVGAIQVAGTDSDAQLPFFVAACDYTLIGEELYAAGAYLSRDPVQVGTLRGQDMLKVFIMAILFIGTLALTAGVLWGFEGRIEQIIEVFRVFA